MTYLIFRVTNGKKSLPHFVIALIVLLTIPDSIGEEWVRAVTYKKDKIESFVDADSITDDGNLKKFKTYHNFRGYKKFRVIPIEKLICKTVVNCDDKTIGYEEEQLELRDGRIAVKELKLEVKPVSNCVDEGISIFVCGYEEKR